MLGGKAYAAEQRFRKFKKFLFKSKNAHKATTTSKRYGYPPETIGEKAVRTETHRDVYAFCRLLKV